MGARVLRLLGWILATAAVLAACRELYSLAPPYENWVGVIQVIERLFSHPILPAQVAALALVSWGGLGAGVGVNALFWARGRWHQFFVGVAVGWLCGQVVFTALILDRVSATAGYRVPPLAFTTSTWWSETSLYPHDFGPDVDPDRATRAFGHALMWVWVWVLALVLVPKLFSRAFWRGQPAADAGPVGLARWRDTLHRPFTSAFWAAPSRHLPLMAGAALAPVLVWVVFLITASTPLHRGARDWVLGHDWALLVAIRSCFAVVAALVLGAIGLYFWRTTATRAKRAASILAPLALLVVAVVVLFDPGSMHRANDKFRTGYDKNPLAWFGMVQSGLSVLLIVAAAAVVVAVPRMRRLTQSPFIVLCALLVAFDWTYGFVWYVLLAPSGMGATLGLLLVAGIVLWGATTNSNEFKYSFNGLKKYYDAADEFYARRRRLSRDVLTTRAQQASTAAGIDTNLPASRSDRSVAGPDTTRHPGPHLVRIDYDENNIDHLALHLRNTRPLSGLIDSEAPLRALHERWIEHRMGAGEKDPRPRIAIVCSSGGGVLAAVWAAVVLEGLETAIPGDPGQKSVGFRDHLRMLTGASGGMVGAALYTSEFERHKHRCVTRDLETGLGPVSEILAQDSLSPVIQTMLWHDLPSIWWPYRVGHDRGKRLEAAWDDYFDRGRGRPLGASRHRDGFRVTFDRLRKLEVAGRCPSLVFSPMLVEDARRVLISNLDLEDLTTAAADRMMPRTTRPAQTLLSRSAVEFFRLFPDAAGAFTLGTAARMNASFPFISPAVPLPTFPPRRVIDAGFYDNFGVGLAVQWILRHEAAIRRHTSGVALIETRAFRYGTTRRHFLDPDVEDELPEGPLEPGQVRRRPPDPAGVAASWASAPLESLLKLRQRGAFYRNDELIELAAGRLNDAKNPSFFTTVGFECPEDAALSWAISPDDAARVGQGFYTTDPVTGRVALNPRVEDQVRQLRDWFGPGGRDMASLAAAPTSATAAV